MAVSLNNVVPRAIVVAAVGYCVYPSLMGLFTERRLPPAVPVPEFSTALLTPEVAAAPERNPFFTKEEELAFAKATASKTGQETAKKNAKRDTQQNVAAVDPMAGLRLESTFLIGNLKLAMINGRSYGVNEVVAASNPGGAKAVVVDIQPHRVLLMCNGKSYELQYLDKLATVQPKESSKESSKESAKESSKKTK
jgi:hypothetical protein